MVASAARCPGGGAAVRQCTGRADCRALPGYFRRRRGGFAGRPYGSHALGVGRRFFRRNFTRRFKAKTGTTVTQWMLNHRLTAAQRLLGTTDKGVDLIAELVGFGSAVSFRQHFTQAFAVSPSAYRKQFGTAVPPNRFS